MRMRDDFDLNDILNEFQEPQAPSAEEEDWTAARSDWGEEPAYREAAADEAPADPGWSAAPQQTYRQQGYRRPAEPDPGVPPFEEEFVGTGRKREPLNVGTLLRGGWDKLRVLGATVWVVLRSYFGEQKEENRLPTWMTRIVTALFLVLSLLCASWILHNVHPGSGTVVRGKPSAALATRLDLELPSGEQAQTPEVEPGEDASAAPTQKKHYVIEREALAAPKPDPSCFGSVSMDQPEKMMEIIQKARDYGLLGPDETVAFDPKANFYRGLYSKDIQYYLDETILVICWKEEIDGSSCSFTEIKLADASQFRRKFADDTFASANQYYSSVLHKSANAVVSLNADFYQNRDFGVVVYDGKLYRFPTGTYTGSYKKYNCLETCFVNEQGDFLFTELGQEFSEEGLEQYIVDNNILFSISFGPVLVQNGQVRECSWYPVGEIEKGYSRAGIGQVDKLHYLYMSLNHGDQAARWTVNEFARHFGEKPVKNAYCLDGGQTAEIVFQGEPYNHVDWGKERPVSDIIYFATAIGGTEVSP